MSVPVPEPATTLLVIAKQPVPGRVKTRLVPPCTYEQAAALAEAALADTLHTVLTVPAGRRVLVSRKWSGKTLADHRADRRTWLTSALGLPATDPARYSWEPVKPGDPDHMPNGQRLLHVVADRIQWQTALDLARRRAAEAELSATGRAA